MGCIFSCKSEVEDKDDVVTVVNTESRKPARSPAGKRKSSSCSQSRNVEPVAVVDSHDENVSTNSHNFNGHLGNKNITSGLTGVVLFAEELPEEKTSEPRRLHIQRSRRRSTSPAGKRKSSSRSRSRNVERVAVVHSHDENVSTNSHNFNDHLGNKIITSGLTGVVLFAEELPEEKTIDLPFKTEKAQFVTNLFSKFSRNNKMILKVQQIKEVNNPYLWTMYNLKKDEMISRDGHVDELFLFHGTKRRNMRSICDDNLNWRLSGSATGNRFGQGVSLSPKATYASHYCDRDMRIKVMFLMRVLFSKAVIGTPDMVIPKEHQNGQTVYYDTSIKEDCSVVVKYCDNEFYPAYVIYFEVL